jgi:DNA-binding response OmpR family regulator
MRLKTEEAYKFLLESDADIRNVYSEYLTTLGIDATVVEDGHKCLSVYDEKKFDLIILDTHLHGISADDVVRKVLDKVPYQRIIFTTASSLEEVRPMIETLPLRGEDILLKPFKFSRLLRLITSNLINK